MKTFYMGPGIKILVHHYMFLKKYMLEPLEEGNDDGDIPIEVEMYLLNTRLSMKAVFYSFSS